MHIWKDVTKVEGGSFPASEYPNLAAYTVEEGSTSYCAEDGVLYDAEKESLVAYPGAKADTDFTVPETVHFLESKAFYGNTKLKHITGGELAVRSQAFYNAALETFSATGIIDIDESAFFGCRNLTAVRYTGELFYGFQVGASAFQNCTSLTQFPFDRINATEHSVFKGCISMTKVEFPKRIESSLFAGCTGLTEITIPATVSYIGGNVFDGCNNLVSVNFESPTPPAIADTGASSPFKPTATEFRIHVPEGSEDAYVEALGEDMAPYILPSDTQFYPLYVNGEWVRSDRLQIPCGTGSAVFDPDTNTLTLTDATITEYGGRYGYKGAINSGLENLTIVLVGNNVIDTEGDSIDTAMDCNLVIRGDGTLTTNGQLDLGREPSAAFDGTSLIGDLTIDGATLHVGNYLWVQHDLTIENGAAVTVTGGITTNNQSTFAINGADTTVTANSLAMGNDRPGCGGSLELNAGSLVLRDGVAYKNPSDGDTSKYAIRFSPKEGGTIRLNGGSFITQSDCPVTNAPVDNIAVSGGLDIRQGSWAGGKIVVSPHVLTMVPGQPATCTTDGTKAYYTCAHCSKIFEDAEGITEITNLDSWKVIPAIGHSPDSAWSSDGQAHWKICTVCHAVIESSRAEHDFRWVTDKEPTATETGSMHEECAVCGFRKDPVEIPASGLPAGPILLPVRTLEEADSDYIARPGLPAAFAPDTAITVGEFNEYQGLAIDYYYPMVDAQLSEGYAIQAEYTVSIPLEKYEGTTLSGTLTVPLPQGYDGASARIKGGAGASGYTATTVSFPVTLHVAGGTADLFGLMIEYKEAPAGGDQGGDDQPGGQEPAGQEPASTAPQPPRGTEEKTTPRADENPAPPIADAPGGGTVIPQTGDESRPLLWIALLMLSGGALAGMWAVTRKKEDKH